MLQVSVLKRGPPTPHMFSEHFYDVYVVKDIFQHCPANTKAVYHHYLSYWNSTKAIFYFG